MMLRNKVVLAALMMAFTLSPAHAAKKPVKHGKASTSSSKKKRSARKPWLPRQPPPLRQLPWQVKTAMTAA